MSNPYIFLIVGASGSGKGLLLRALRDMGQRHVIIIPKQTTRRSKTTNGDEMISIYPKKKIDPKFNIIYGNWLNKYGICSSDIWENIKKGKYQVLIVSNLNAIKKLYHRFGPLIKLIYLYSPVDKEQLEKHQKDIAAENKNEIEVRKSKIKVVHDYYVDNITMFDHVLLNMQEPEDLCDQIFRLFQYYREKEF